MEASPLETKKKRKKRYVKVWFATPPSASPGPHVLTRPLVRSRSGSSPPRRVGRAYKHQQTQRTAVEQFSHVVRMSNKLSTRDMHFAGSTKPRLLQVVAHIVPLVSPHVMAPYKYNDAQKVVQTGMGYNI